jgi:hypothetical protein
MAQTSASTHKIGLQAEVICCVYHECGHVLFGLLKHFHVSSVFVNYTEAVEGITNYFWVDKPDLEQDIIQHIALDEIGISYSGFIAEQIYYKDICGAKLPWVLKEGSSLDIKSASKTIKDHSLAAPGKPRQQLKQRVQKEVNALLSEYWDDLKLIAHRLYKVKRMSFDDLKALLTKKSNRKDFWKKQFREIELLFGTEPPDDKEVRRILMGD